jgi:hypothetical protein
MTGVIAGGFGGGIGGGSAPVAGGYGLNSSMGSKPSGGGGGGFWGSWTDPLGLVSGVKNMATGLATSFGGIGAHTLSGLVDTGYQGMTALTGGDADWGQAGSEFRKGIQGTGDVAVGIGLGLEGLSTSAANLVGAQNVLRDDIYRPLNHYVAGKDEHGDGTWNSLISPEMGANLYGGGKGLGPKTWWDEARTEGAGAATLNTLASAAIVAGPVAGAAAGYAAGAADAAAGMEAAAAAADATGDASGAAEASDLASKYRSRAQTADQLSSAAQTVHTVGRFGYNPFGAVGELAANQFGKLADESLASAPEGEVPKSAQLYRRAATLGQLANSPMKFLGMNAADLLAAMHEQANPTILPDEGRPVPPEGAGAQEATQGVSEQDLALVRNAQNAETAAGEALGQAQQAQSPDTMSELEKAALEAAAAQPSASTGPTPEAAPGMTRLYYGGDGGEELWSQTFERSQGYAGDKPVRYVDIPEASAQRLSTEDVLNRAREAGHQPKTGEQADVFLAEHPRFEELRNGAQDYVPAEAPSGEPAPKAEVKIEPAKYNTESGRPPVPPEEVAARQEAVREDTAAARDNSTPGTYVEDKLGQRLTAPVPQWAENLASKLAPSINRNVGKLAGFVTEVRLRNLARSLTQALETSQQIARSDPAMQSFQAAGEMILDRNVTRSQASDIFGQEVFAHLYGEYALTEWLKNNNGFSPSQDQLAALTNAARGRWHGMTDEMWNKLSPEDATALREHIKNAAETFKETTLKTRETLLASRYGAKGLEHALLDPNDPGMTREQLRLYSRSIRDQRFAAKALERVPGERERIEAKAAVAAATGERKWGVVDRLRARLGLTEATTEDLYRGIPDGMKNNAEKVINDAVGAIASGLDHVVIDPATGSIEPPDAGIFVPMALQGAGVPLESWATDGPEAVRNSILFPTSKDGGTYDPVRLFTGMDARVVLAKITDADGVQRVQPILGMHSINGEPIMPWQARILGDAFEQNAGYNFADQSNMTFSGTPQQQVAASWYVGDVLDPRSQLSRWANEKAGAASALGIGPEQVSAEITAMLTLDQVMAQRPNGWKTGDIFKTETAVGKGAPVLSSLLQTIMPDLTTAEHFEQAIANNDFESVNNALAWYYTSHDAIERMWRYNEDGSVKMTPFGRPAADTFYDLVALTSVMASPTQNLGRALAGYANLDEFLQSRADALTDVTKVMNEVMGNKPAQVAYVKNLGVDRESYIAENPQQVRETKAAFERRVARSTEREVGKGEGGTAVSRRWLDSPVARDLSKQTSMTTSPKYRIIDALLGKLDLSTATAEDIGKQPEFWMENGGQAFSDKSLAPSAVLHHAELLGITGPAVDAYQQWGIDHANLVGAREVREGKDWVKPITDSEDVQRQRAERDAVEKGIPILGGREVGPQEYQDLANDGRAYIERAKASSSPHVLDTPELRKAAWDALHPTDPSTWPGGTFDAHTGQPIPGDYRGDTYAVTAKTGKMKTETVALDATPKQFDAAYTKALKNFAPILNSEGGHLGIFENHDTGKIEFDPVYHTTNVHDTEAVGSYTHAHGGAYNFATEYAYWLPHVKDELTWSAKSGDNGPSKAVSASVERGRALAKDPTLRPAYENALMEYHGSGLLAKLRSFRDNLADPHNSLAVTLDSIMAQLWGIEGTPWATKNEYAGYADEVRAVAKAWSGVAGRQVMPHEVQAALWVHAKRFIGEQDWGRWNAHLTKALSLIDDFEKVRNEGKIVKLPSTADLLSEAWREELQHSRDHLAVRTERTPLREQSTAAAKGKAEPLTPEQQARLDYLEQVPGRRVSQVRVQPDGQPAEWQQRDETYYDANTLRSKEDQYVQYLTKYASPIRDALLSDNFDEARKLVREYVVGRQKSMLQGIDGGAFDEVLRKSAGDTNSVTFKSLLRLAQAEHVPHPNVDGLNTGEVYNKFLDRVRGATLEHPNQLGRIMMRLYQTADFTTLLHEDLHAFRLMAPGDEVAKLSEEYPHIQDATLTPERRADEERFVEDTMKYIYDRARAGDPRLSPAMRAQVKYTGPLKDLFNNVADAVDEYSRAALQTTNGHTISPQVVDYWDSVFNQDIVKPDIFHDPLSDQYAAENKGVNPKQLRGESDFNYTQRVRQYGEGRGQQEGLKRSIAEATRRAQEADKFAAKMKEMISQPTRSEAIAAKLSERATNTLGKVAGQMENPDTNQIPKMWRPFAEAIDRIAEQAKTDPSMAPILSEVAGNFPKILEFAAQLGFEPAYMPDLTWQMAARYMYGHLTLGSNAEESSMRKLNTGVLNRAGITERSMEALGSAQVMAMKELLGSRLVQFVEEHYARQWRAGVEIPQGWQPWSGTRDAILTGKNIEGKRVAASDTLIVPDAVHQTLRRMSAQPVDMPFRTLWKGGPTQVWKNLILTWSPTWYLKHFIGSTTLAALEGVRLQDWRTAWKQFKANEYPDVVKGKTIYGALDLDTKSLLKRNRISDFPDLVRAEGYRAAAHEVTAKLQNVVKTVDSFNRAAVYARALRLTDNPEFAASRAMEALGDFGRLSPLERSAVSSLIPFYSFQKAMFRILLRLPIEHPFVTVGAIQLGLMHQQYLKDKLGGQVPDAYLSAIDINGHLTPVDKMNPLTDAYKLVTPGGIAASLHPFIKPFAEDAFGGQSYGSGIGMTSTGGIQPQADVNQQLQDLYTNIPALGGSPLSVYSGLSQKQYESLVKRVARYGKAKQTVDAGGYLVTDANQAKKASPLGGAHGAAGGWG